MPGFNIITEEKIKSGKATDIYFSRMKEILEAKNKNPQVVAEITASTRGILAGLNEAVELLRDKPINVYSMEEGTFFWPNEPVMAIEGDYLDFCELETSLLGFLCHNSGVATKAARIKKAAGDTSVLSFGTRRQHPSLAGVIERSSYLGGMDGVSNEAGAESIDIKPSGTMPHALVLCFKKQEEAWRSYDEVLDKEIPRVMLCDTFSDEKEEVMRAARELGDSLDAVRIDTPGSRRGDLKEIVKEIKWELEKNGFEDVEIFVSGGLDEEEIIRLKEYVDGFGVGTSVSSADPIDFGMDLVEVNGESLAKRGKYSGKKQVYRSKDFKDEILLRREPKPKEKKPLLKPLIKDGEIKRDISLKKARKKVLNNINEIPLNESLTT
ncbi:MAG: Nicotinic acid phosphoribosyltransferase PncB [Candidatus Methanohalarchaeum thermophilum]|uniref:nicotinate phosphoribosyltransferase n=1 Tax=Methanohalarchaeum thermophilum TaxID=1903181 RepID=A0A1Q6DU54_METT1|nr:MAG: Nicotinic acid phosphoribosyltransferase PncB [Candidatus Methanohalarchaeum thermophilum]